VADKDDYLLDMLLDLGFLTPDQVASARTEAHAAGVSAVELLLANKVIRPADVTQAKAAHFGAEVVNLNGMQVSDEVIATVPRTVARKYRIVPIYQHDGSITVAIADPSDIATIDALGHVLNADVQVQVASDQDIETALSKYYGGGTAGGESWVDKAIIELTKDDVGFAAPDAADDGAAVETDAPLIKLVNQIIVDAFKMRASDIHLEPMSKSSGCATASTACCTR
jgi:type IV pilus assembly protein PilB